MPKQRTDTISTVSNSGSGAIGGSGSGMSPGIIGNLAGRINNRLRQRITVESYSRTRDRSETVTVEYDEDRDRYNVQSNNEIYTVNLEGRSCNCPQHIYRGGDCRHIQAVDEAINQAGNEIRNIGNEDVMRTRISQDVRDEVQRTLEGVSEDDAFFYIENPEEFERTLDNIEDSMINYEYQNVLNGNTSTFGIELEFVGGNSAKIARELYDLGLTASPNRLDYHSRVPEGMWRLENDSTVSSGIGGGEIVSPVLKDTPETWKQIHAICDVAKRHGARIDSRCGAHVHIGMNKLDTARQRWRRFFKIVGSYEECIYRVAGGELGRVRSDSSRYARDFSQRARETENMRFTVESDADVMGLASRVSDMSRYYGINLKNIATRRAPTVEFRYFNGSLNPKQIQANIKLAAGIINAAEKAKFRDTEDENYKKRGNLLKSSGENIKSINKMKELVDIVFTRKKDKDALINVFKNNNWR